MRLHSTGEYIVVLAFTLTISMIKCSRYANLFLLKRDTLFPLTSFCWELNSIRCTLIQVIMNTVIGCLFHTKTIHVSKCKYEKYPLANVVALFMGDTSYYYCSRQYNAWRICSLCLSTPHYKSSSRVNRSRWYLKPWT